MFEGFFSRNIFVIFYFKFTKEISADKQDMKIKLFKVGVT
jgi:hypothetical protein